MCKKKRVIPYLCARRSPSFTSLQEMGWHNGQVVGLQISKSQFETWPCHCNSTRNFPPCYLSPLTCINGYPQNIAKGNLVMHQHPVQGGEDAEILPAALCYRNWDKFWLCGPQQLMCYLTMQLYQSVSNNDDDNNSNDLIYKSQSICARLFPLHTSFLKLHFTVKRIVESHLLEELVWCWPSLTPDSNKMTLKLMQ